MHSWSESESQPFGKDLTGELVNVVVGFKNPNRN